MRLALPLVALTAFVLAAYAPGPASGSAAPAAPDSSQWENLQVLPDTISRERLFGIMQSFTGALGVQCGHCHVREDGEFAFPSDDNPHKDVARGMMRMTMQINREALPAIEGLHNEGEAMRVTCYTCHRGAPTPATGPEAEDAPEEDDAPEADDAGHDHGGHDHGDHDHGDGRP